MLPVACEIAAPCEFSAPCSIFQHKKKKNVSKYKLKWQKLSDGMWILRASMYTGYSNWAIQIINWTKKQNTTLIKI
jgi:hypothetical protein